MAGSPNMDVKLAPLVSRCAASLLALGMLNRVVADDDVVIAADTAPSMLVVTASDAGAELQQPPALSGTELVVHAGDEEQQQQAPRVKANTQPKKPLSAIVIDPDVTQAVSERTNASSSRGGSVFSGMFSGGPQRPSAASGIQAQQRNRMQAPPEMPPARPLRRPNDPSQPIPRPLSNAKRTAPATARPSRGPAATHHADDESTQPAGLLLIQAYDLSLKAGAEAEYSQIVRWCAEAMKQGLEGENEQFALQLSAWALNRRGQLRADANQRDLAVADFRAALDFDSNCWRARHNRSVSLAQGGHFAEAFDDVCKVIELNPKFAKAYANRGTLYVQAGQPEKAIADYDEALKIDPGLAAALIARGRLCHLNGRLDEAYQNLTTAIEVDPANAEVICSRGDLLVDLGRYSEALQDYARAIDLNPKFEHAYRNGAWLLATCPDDSVRDVEGALKGAQAALDCGYGDRHAALDTLAAALANAGRFEEAVGTIQQAIEIAPEEAKPAYQARQQLYEGRQPFRTHPVNKEVQTAEYVEANG
jgi:tetratricopeptide (TPR) repeat protein